MGNADLGIDLDALTAKLDAQGVPLAPKRKLLALEAPWDPTQTLIRVPTVATSPLTGDEETLLILTSVSRSWAAQTSLELLSMAIAKAVQFQILKAEGDRDAPHPSFQGAPA